MGFMDNAKKVVAVGGIVAGVASAPMNHTSNTADTRSEAKAAMRDRANNEASRMRGETRAKGSRNGGSGQGK